MSTSFNVSGLGFATITTAAGSTTMAVQGVSYSPNLGREPFRSGGDLSPSMMRRAGSRPAFRIAVPMSVAWTMLGQFLPVNVTAFTMYEPLFSGTGPLLRTTTSTTVGLTPTTGGAIGYISRIYPSGGSVPMMLAEVTVLLCSTDGLTDPVTVGSGTLPSLSANPVLHTIGPMSDSVATRWGTRAWSLDTGLGMEAIQADGLFYPTTYRLGAIQATATVAHNDVKSLYASLGDLALDAGGSGFVLWTRAYDAASKVLQATGYSFTMAKGIAAVESFGAEGTNREEMALTISSYAAPNALTYPITVSTTATLPT